MSWIIEDVETCTAFNIHAGFDSSGNPHIGYVKSNYPISVEFKHAWREAGVWSTETIGTFTYGYASFGFGWDIHDNTMHAAWINYPNPSFPYGNLTITHASATVGGSWSTETHVPSAYGGGISVVVDSTGDWHLFWLGWLTGIPGRAIYVNSSWAETVIQESIGQVGWANGHNFYCDDDDILHAFWYKRYPTSMEGLFYANSGGWSPQTIYSRAVAGSDLYADSVAVNSSGNVGLLAYIATAENFYLDGSSETFGDGAECDCDLRPRPSVWWGVSAPWSGDGLKFLIRSSGTWSSEDVIASSSGYPALAISAIGIPAIAFSNSSKLRFATRGAGGGRWTMMALGIG